MIVATRKPLALIFAMSDNRCIGRDGGLPWHIPEDLKHFKHNTLDHAIIMGRKTYESIGRPLPHRKNIIVTSRTDWHPEGCDVVPTIEAAIDLAHKHGDTEPRIIGGASIYAAALPLATKLLITYVHADVPGDTFFPPFDESEWKATERRKGEDPRVEFVTYERVPVG